LTLAEYFRDEEGQDGKLLATLRRQICTRADTSL
jgi:hypothetical protein